MAPLSPTPRAARDYFKAHLATVMGVDCYSMRGVAPSLEYQGALEVSAIVHYGRGDRRCERRAKSCAVESMLVWIEPNGLIYGEW